MIELHNNVKRIVERSQEDGLRGAPDLRSYDLPATIEQGDCFALAGECTERTLDVWHIPLTLDEDTLTARRDVLATDEVERMNRFSTDRLKDRYAGARGGMRIILSAYLQLPAMAVRFGYGAQGKPHLETQSAIGDRLQFNISHSGDVALLAVTRLGSVGIDVQHVKPAIERERLAERYFARREAAAIEALSEAQKEAAFFALWTRKEAFIKTTGEGMSRALDSFEISVDPTAPPQLTAISAHGEEARDSIDNWRIYSLLAQPHLHASVRRADDWYLANKSIYLVKHGGIMEYFRMPQIEFPGRLSPYSHWLV